jgi:hypothetical protein
MRFTLPYNLYRIMGITTLFLLLYIVVIGIFGRVDITGLLPIKLAASIQQAWPEMPFFSTAKTVSDDGKEKEVYYTVPTRQLTPQEVAKLEALRKPVEEKSKDSK